MEDVISECDGRSDAARCGGASTNAASLADSIIDKLASSSRFQHLNTTPHRPVTAQRVEWRTIDIEKDLARLPVSAPSTFEQSPENGFETTPSSNRDAKNGESTKYAPDPELTVEVDCSQYFLVRNCQLVSQLILRYYHLRFGSVVAWQMPGNSRARIFLVLAQW